MRRSSGARHCQEPASATSGRSSSISHNGGGAVSTTTPTTSTNPTTSTTHLYGKRRKKGQRKQLRKKNRMDASKRLVVMYLIGTALLLMSLLIYVGFVSPVPTKKHRKNRRRRSSSRLRGKTQQDVHHALDANEEQPTKDKQDNILLDALDEQQEQHHHHHAAEFQRYTDGAPTCEDDTIMDPSDVSYTLVTQLSMDRIWMMQHHCDRWGSVSPISVAVFTNQTSTEIIRQLVQEYGCSVDTLTVQTLPPDNQYSMEDYPVNILRNMALSAVRTSHVMYTDVDFWESEDLHDLLYLSSIREALAQDVKQAIVIPAFQLNRQCRDYRDCREINIPRMPRNRHDIANLVKNKQGLYPFDPTNRGGHGSTLYKEWISSLQAGELLDLPCIKSNRYEPYMVWRHCHLTPPFQPLFSGYGKNKMTMVMHMRRNGYQFSQISGGFVVHYPHLDSTSRMEWNRRPKELLEVTKDKEGRYHPKSPMDVDQENWMDYKRGRVDELFVEFRNWLLQEIPDESSSTRVPMCDDAEDDDARLWIDRSSQ